ncbi:MAG TPA: hypothetical protein VGL17_05075 [Gemmatimonadaceae bacterium]
MNVLLFGGTGMVGDGVLHECLADPRVTSVLALGRSSLGVTHSKLREIRRKDFFDYSDLAGELGSIDACYFCLGVSAAGMSEAAYRRQTFDLTLSAARALAAAHPNATFCYVSGEGTDSSERGRTMWARVKGATENALLQHPLSVYLFRPGFIRARPGVRSKTRLYRILYPIIRPFFPLLRQIAPKHVTTAENIGRAMIAVSIGRYPKRVLENPDINAAAGDT